MSEEAGSKRPYTDQSSGRILQYSGLLEFSAHKLTIVFGDIAFNTC